MISVLIATRDRPGLLEKAVEAALAQDYAGPLEIIVIFDQTEPRELAPAQPVPGRSVVSIRNVRRQGLAGGRNTGIEAARGEYVAFCDDDDAWLPGKLTAQIDLLGKHPESFASGTGIEIRSPEGSTTRLVPYPAVEFRHLLADRVMEMHPSSVVVHRERLLNEVGLVDEDLPGSYAEDYDLALRIARIAPIPCVDRPLTLVNWGGSFFADRFPMIADALAYLLEKYPEFATEPAGLARIEGQVAFYRAASGAYGPGRRWAIRALRHNWREPRAYLAFAVGTRLVTGARVLKVLNARGRGI